MRKSLYALSLCLAVAALGTPVARADDVCTAGERQRANAGLARAKAADAAGNAAEALRLARGVDLCVDDEAGRRSVIVRNSNRLGEAAESAGNLKAAFEYYEGAIPAEQYVEPKPFGVLQKAKRVGLAWLKAEPTNRALASNLLSFMNRQQLADGVAAVQEHVVAQSKRLLAEEQQRFTVNAPHTELLEQARDWLVAGEITGTPPLPKEARAAIDARSLARGDQMAALDYATALQYALGYYEDADRKDKQDAVRSKARRLADGLAGGNNWAEAVRLYELAGDSAKAEALTKQREASAAEREAARQDRFKKEQDDLEKELGF